MKAKKTVKKKVARKAPAISKEHANKCATVVAKYAKQQAKKGGKKTVKATYIGFLVY